MLERTPAATNLRLWSHQVSRGFRGSMWGVFYASAFIAAYVFLERVSFVYQLDGLGITLWSPAAGVGVFTLMHMGFRAAPLILIATFITDCFVFPGARGIATAVTTSLMQTASLTLIASCFGFAATRKMLLTRTTIILLIGPASALVASLFYCVNLVGLELLTTDRFVVATRNLWIGNTLGLITLIPALEILADAFRGEKRPIAVPLLDFAIFALASATALWIIFGLRRSQEYQFFYLLFIPVIWIAIRTGYVGIALSLPVLHSVIVLIASYSSYATYDFVAFQLLMIVLSGTGLLLGAAVADARTSAEHIRRQENELARAQRHALVGATGTALAHEISQPLASTTNYLHAARRLLRGALGPNKETIASTLDKAVEEAKRARETLERVRDYIARGRVELARVDLRNTVHKIAGIIGPQPKDGVRISVVTGSDLPEIYGDEVQLEQLLLNVMNNAVEAARLRSDGLGLVTVRIASSRDSLTIAVSDNGPGVDQGISERLFEPFETSKKDGMGLGLTLAHQIVKAHRGRIEWQNTSSGGAEFIITLRREGPAHHDT